jgi:hypothetical protein
MAKAELRFLVCLRSFSGIELFGCMCLRTEGQSNFYMLYAGKCRTLKIKCDHSSGLLGEET